MQHEDLFRARGDGLRKLVCHHSDRTYTDAEGNAVCFACGSLVSVALTPEKLARAFDRLRRA